MKEKLCQEICEELGAYVYETVPDDVSKHLESCSQCQQDFAELQSTHTYIKDILGAPDIKKELEIKAKLKGQILWQIQTKWQHKVVWWGAVAASLLFITGVFLGSKMNEIPEKPVEVVTEELPASEQLSWLSPKGLEFLKYGEQGNPNK